MIKKNDNIIFYKLQTMYKILQYSFSSCVGIAKTPTNCLFHTTTKMGLPTTQISKLGGILQNTTETITNGVIDVGKTTNTFLIDGVEYSIDQSINKTIKILHDSIDKCHQKGLTDTSVSATVDIGIIKLTLTKNLNN